MINVATVTQQRTIIEVPATFWKTGQILSKVRKLCDGAEDVLRTAKKVGTDGYREPARILIITPADLGFERLLPPWFVRQVAEREGFMSCHPSVPIRIALEFDRLRSQLPAKYLERTWWTHTNIVETGGPNVQGFGTPGSILNIRPYTPSSILENEYVYPRTGRHGVEHDQPILFALRD